MSTVIKQGLGLDPDKIIRRSIAIADKRDQYFMDMLEAFRKRFPALKIIYANNTMGARLDPDNPSSDFVIIIKGMLTSKDPNCPPKHIVIIDTPMIFTERSIAGWTLAVEEGHLKEYFEYMLDKALRIDSYKFEEYIQHMCLLSLDPKEPLYWKKPENAKKLTSELMELYARYSMKRSTKLEDSRGYTNGGVVATDS